MRNPRRSYEPYALVPTSLPWKPENSDEAGTVHVLFAEHDPVARELGRRALARVGCQVETVSDGDSAVIGVRTGHYDLLFLNCGVFLTEGIRTARAIRQMDGTRRSIPIIGMSTDVLELHHKDAWAAGISDWLVKPTPPRVYVTALVRWIRRCDARFAT